jgi:hypothetical protein
MTKTFATYAAAIALSLATTVAAQAASHDPAADQRENPVTAQLNQQQLQGSSMSYGAGMSYGTETYQGIMQNRGMIQDQVAQPPAGSSDLSIIE